MLKDQGAVERAALAGHHTGRITAVPAAADHLEPVRTTESAER